MKRYFYILGLCVAFIGASLSHVKSAAADLLITPYRVVFEDGQRFQEVNIVNSGNNVNTYEISWKHLTMSEAGGYDRSDVEPVIDGFDVAKHVVYSPRRITLTPGAKQKIRLAFRRPEDVPNGDFHSHLKFNAVPTEDNGPDLQVAGDRSTEVGVSVNISYSIPVVVRIGALQSNATIDALNLSRSPKSGALVADVTVGTSGVYGVLGRLFVYHSDANGNGQKLIGEVSNANLFTEISKRTFSIGLNEDVSAGQLRVVLMGYGDDDSVLAEKTFPLQ